MYLISVFIGQLIGSSVGTRIFVQHGQHASGGFCLSCSALVALLIRGPEAKTWFGWTGDNKHFRRQPLPREQDVEKQAVPEPDTKTEQAPKPEEPNTASDRALEDRPEDEPGFEMTPPKSDHSLTARQTA